MELIKDKKYYIVQIICASYGKTCSIYKGTFSHTLYKGTKFAFTNIDKLTTEFEYDVLSCTYINTPKIKRNYVKQTNITYKSTRFKITPLEPRINLLSIYEGGVPMYTFITNSKSIVKRILKRNFEKNKHCRYNKDSMYSHYIRRLKEL